MKWLFLVVGLAVIAGLLVKLTLVEKKPFIAPLLIAPDQPLNVYHLGHSLVGKDMPHMVAQLAGQGHTWNSQLGWGTPLKSHWEPDIEIAGFEENVAPAYRDAREAIGSGEYDAVVLTEMVELEAAIRYFDAARYLRRWADLARGSSPDTVVYLYETWHELDVAEGWLERIDEDLEARWIGKVLGPDTRKNPDRPVYLIPGGQALAAVTRAAEAGEIAGITSREQLFARTEEGELDTIHINDLGVYVVALTHYAVLYQRSPEGAPYKLELMDGSAAKSFSGDAAARVQAIVWKVVSNTPRTGISTQVE